jgi:hypothetical protein
VGNLINSGFKTFTKKKGRASFSRCEAFFIHFWAHPLTLLLIGRQGGLERGCDSTKRRKVSAIAGQDSRLLKVQYQKLTWRARQTELKKRQTAHET